jgi:hypothetical protein
MGGANPRELERPGTCGAYLAGSDAVWALVERSPHSRRPPRGSLGRSDASSGAAGAQAGGLSTGLGGGVVRAPATGGDDARR